MSQKPEREVISEINEGEGVKNDPYRYTLSERGEAIADELEQVIDDA